MLSMQVITSGWPLIIKQTFVLSIQLNCKRLYPARVRKLAIRYGQLLADVYCVTLE